MCQHNVSMTVLGPDIGTQLQSVHGDTCMRGHVPRMYVCMNAHAYMQTDQTSSHACCAHLAA